MEHRRIANADLCRAHFPLARLAAGEATPSRFLAGSKTRRRGDTCESVRLNVSSIVSIIDGVAPGQTNVHVRYVARKSCIECMGCEKGRWSVVEIERMECRRKRRPGRCRCQKSHFDSTHRGRLFAGLSICIFTPYSCYPFDWREFDVVIDCRKKKEWKRRRRGRNRGNACPLVDRGVRKTLYDARKIGFFV